MKKYNTAGQCRRRSTVYGYTAAQTMVAVLKACGDNLTRENVMKQAASLHDLKLPMLAARHHHLDQRQRLRADQADAVAEIRRQHLAAVRRGDLGFRHVGELRGSARRRCRRPAWRSAPQGRGRARRRRRARATRTASASAPLSRSRPDASGASGPISPSTARRPGPAPPAPHPARAAGRRPWPRRCAPNSAASALR